MVRFLNKTPRKLNIETLSTLNMFYKKHLYKKRPRPIKNQEKNKKQAYLGICKPYKKQLVKFLAIFGEKSHKITKNYKKLCHVFYSPKNRPKPKKI